MENELMTLLGGVTIEVVNRKGEKEEVRVRELRISDYETLAKIVDDEEKLAALYCERPQEWVAMLTHESLEAIILEGDKMNFDPFDRWLTRRAARTSRVAKALGSNKKESAAN